MLNAVLLDDAIHPPSRGSRHTFAWLEEELYALDEVVAFASKRLEGAADVLEQEFFRRVELVVDSARAAGI